MLIKKLIQKKKDGSTIEADFGADAVNVTEDASHRFVTDAEKSKWNNKASTAAATQSTNGLMAAADKKKLDGVAEEANKYIHPSTHPASMITQDATHRFATDAEKTTWNAAEKNAIDAIKALMVSQQVDDTGKIPTSALVYAMQQAIIELNSNLSGLIIKNTVSNRVNVSAGAQSYTYISVNLPDGYSVLSVSAVAAHYATLCGTASISGGRVYIPYSATAAQTPETFTAEIVLLKTL